MEGNMKLKDISEIDLKHSFFHYTNKDNIDNIVKYGLEPKIGNNSIYVEQTPKVFFAEGEKGIITIMDVWMRWLTSKSRTNRFIYWLGTCYMRKSYCIKNIPNYVVKRNLNDLKKRNRVYEKMKSILDNSVFLVLELVENVDFDYNDIDEVKSIYYESFLKLLYPKSSDIKDLKMEYWNMHTYSNKSISPEKIALLEDNGSYVASKILNNIVEKNIEYVKNNCEFLYEYYIYNQN